MSERLRNNNGDNNANRWNGLYDSATAWKALEQNSLDNASTDRPYDGNGTPRGVYMEKGDNRDYGDVEHRQTPNWKEREERLRDPEYVRKINRQMNATWKEEQRKRQDEITSRSESRRYTTEARVAKDRENYGKELRLKELRGVAEAERRNTVGTYGYENKALKETPEQWHARIGRRTAEMIAYDAKQRFDETMNSGSEAKRLDAEIDLARAKDDARKAKAEAILARPVNRVKLYNKPPKGKVNAGVIADKPKGDVNQLMKEVQQDNGKCSVTMSAERGGASYRGTIWMVQP